MSYHTKTIDAAKGKWRGVLLHLGMADNYLTGKPGPCPICSTGTDRFVFDNKEGRGSWLCRASCGAGDGMDLVMRFLGCSFADAASRVDAILGNEKIGTEKPREALSEENAAALVRETWGRAVRVGPGDLVDRYLTQRGVGQRVYPVALRFASALRDGEGGVRPCMVAAVQGLDGKCVTLHRTFLRPDGLAKAEMEAPRKLMPGSLPDGACVRLSEFHGGPLGIAEGIETAMAASELYGLPVWAAINARMMTKWRPPEGCEEVAIFADHDATFTGHAAAWVLANRLKVRHRIETVTVHLPEVVGEDWNDVLLGKQGKRGAA